MAITRTGSGRLDAQRHEESRSGAGAGARLDATVTRTQARDALVGLGWNAAIARAAVDEAWSHVEPTTTIDVPIHEALRRCRKPTG